MTTKQADMLARLRTAAESPAILPSELDTLSLWDVHDTGGKVTLFMEAGRPRRRKLAALFIYPDGKVKYASHDGRLRRLQYPCLLREVLRTGSWCSSC